MPGTRWGRLRTVGGRIVALFAASALGVGLAACGSSSSDSGSAKKGGAINVAGAGPDKVQLSATVTRSRLSVGRQSTRWYGFGG